MPNDRLLRILSRLNDGDGSTSRLCAVCAEITEMSGAGIMLLSGERPQGSICTTDAVSARIEELQYTLGEGPCVDAHRHHAPVLEPDLANPTVVRWTTFSRSAVTAGARAVFGFPVAVGEVRVGALYLYRDRPGPLTSEQHADALLVAQVAARSIIAMQADAVPGELGAELEAGGDFRFVVHQAAGMVAVQLGATVDEAMVRLRAHAFRTDTSVVDVAELVMSRRLRFDPDDPAAG
jgi:GAF domain-containing protein